MTEAAREVREKLLALPLADRLALAREILKDDGEDNEDEGADWPEDPARTAEIDRRVRESLDGKAPGIPWETVRAELHAKLGLGPTPPS